MQFVKEFGVLDEKLQNQIKDHVKADQAPFEPSMVYQSDLDLKTIKPDKRLSEFKLFTEKALFDLCQQLVDLINQKDKTMEFMLLKNDITHIRYWEGGYFKSHEDYLSLTSNIIEEYTLIMCLEGNCQGGETILHLNDFFSYPSRATITPNHCLVFRKDIKHEGATIIHGTKEIITLNLWGFTKDLDNPVVIVTFPTEKLSPDKTYAIAIDRVMALGDNVLKSYLSFHGKNNFQFFENDINKNLGQNIIFQENNFTYQDFEIIYKIYNGSYINYTDYYRYQEIIDYYGFNWKDLLVKGLQKELVKRESHPEEVVPVDPLKQDVFICESLNHYKEILENIKQMGLPFMPFQVLMAEGGLSFGGGASDNDPETITMSPVWASFSEEMNIMFWSHLLSTGINIGEDGLFSSQNFLDYFNFSKEDQERFNALDDKTPICLGDDEWLDEDEEEDINATFGIPDGFRGETNYLGLSFSLKKEKENLSLKSIIELLLTENYWGPLKFYKSGTKSVKKSSKIHKYYVINDKKKLSLNPEHYSAIYQRCKDLDLYQQIRDKLKIVKFVLPQVSESISHDFCNEQVYGNFTFLMVYGFMKMKALF